MIPYGVAPVKRWIIERLGGECVLRMDQKQCFPVITENHNYLLDWHFPRDVDEKRDWQKIHESLIKIIGTIY